MTTLSGILQAPDGTAIAGAKITFEAVRNYSEVTYHASSTLITGVDGSYSITLAVGSFNVFINYGTNRIITVGMITILDGSIDGTLNDYLLTNNDPAYVLDVLSRLSAPGGVALVNGAMDKAQNLNDVTDKAAARTNLDVDSKDESQARSNAVLSSLAAENGVSMVGGAMDKSQNLADVESPSDARDNLGVYSVSEIDLSLSGKVSTGQLALPDGTKLIGRCSDIAAARSIEPVVVGQLLDVVAYSSGWDVATNPLGGGRFFYDAADTTSVDDGGVVIVTAGGKRWRRIYNGSVFAEWFGVKSDGTTDDTTNLRKAIAYAKTTSYPSVRLRQGNTVISDVINLNGVAGTGFGGCKLIGENRKTTAILFKPAAIDSICINIIGGSGNISSAGLQGLTIKPFNSSYNLLGTGFEINSACYVHVDDVDIQTLNVGYSLHNGTTGGFSEFNIFTRCRAFQNNINRQYIRTLGNDSFHGNRFEGFMNQVKSSGGIGIYVKGRDTSNIAWVYNNRCCDNFFGAAGAYAIVLENANTTGVTGDLTAEQDLICKSDDNSWWTQAGRFDSIGNVTFEVTTEIAAKNGRFSWSNKASKDSVFFVNSPLTEATPKPVIQPADIPNAGAHGTVYRAVGVGLDAIIIASQGGGDAKNGLYIGNINSSGDWQSYNHGFFLSSGGSIFRSVNGAGFAVQIGTTSRYQFSPSGLRPFVDGGVNLGDPSFEFNNNYCKSIVASSGGTIAGNQIVSKVSVPATATSIGVIGQIASDSSFLYICTATNTWRRVAIATW